MIDPRTEKDLSEIGAEIRNGKEKTSQVITDLEGWAGFPYLLEKLVATARSLLDDFRQISETFEIFWQNYQDMKKANTIGADKYFSLKSKRRSSPTWRNR